MKLVRIGFSPSSLLAALPNAAPVRAAAALLQRLHRVPPEDHPQHRRRLEHQPALRGEGRVRRLPRGLGTNPPTTSPRCSLPTPDTCGECHETQVKQFKGGKHALAWAAMKAMPTIHWQPMAMTEGMKGCGACHKIGLKTPQEIKDLKQTSGGYGVASCDACHTRHTFSKKEAQQPQACETCHMGFDHPQWEMYSGFQTRRARAAQADRHACPTSLPRRPARPATSRRAITASIPRGASWPCACPMPEDKQWADDRATILQALGVLDPDGKPTARLEVVKAANVAKLTQEDWQKQRDKMLPDLQPVPLRQFRQAATGAGRQHDSGGRPAHGRGHPHRRRAVQGRRCCRNRRAMLMPSPTC